MIVIERIRAFKEFKDYPDEQVVALAKAGNDHALDYLMHKYKMLVEKKSKSYFLMGAGKDDIIQEGMIGLFKAIRDYKDDQDASFYSFADLCVTRQMITAVKAATRLKHMPLNSYVSLNKPAYEEENDKTALLELLPSSKADNPEDLFISEENLSTIEHEMDEKLSRFEKEVLAYYINGVGYVDIAARLGKPVKSIDNALQRIKKKVEGILIDKGL